MVYRLGELAEVLGCRLEGDPEARIEGVVTLDQAGPEHLSFLTNARYREQALESGAGAILVSEDLAIEGRNLLRAKNPYVVLARVLELFHPHGKQESGVHPTATVEADASVHPSAWVGPGSVIGSGVVLEEGVQVHPLTVVGKRSRIGRETILYPRVVVYPDTQVGARCIVHSGAVLGSDGFGFATQGTRHVKVPQVGRLVVEDDVEIGANTTLDRATLGETRVGEGTKIDNLVQVAHGVKVGRSCFLVSQCGIAGSTRLGDFVVLAGQVGVAGHLEIGDGVQVAGASAVFRSIPEGKAGGYPAIEVGQWHRQTVLLSRLGEMQQRIAELESQLAAIEKEGGGE